MAITVKEEAKTPIEKAMEKFEELKAGSQTLRDAVYLDGVLAVLESIKPYEQDYIKTLKGNNYA